MTVIRFDPFRDPLERLLSMAATGTRAPLGMPMDVYRAGDGSYHVEADRRAWTRTASRSLSSTVP